MGASQNAVPVAQPPLVIGEVIAGRYLIEERLGAGGMASVYRATHLALEQPVAIKVASEALLSMPGIVERFLQEARAATRLKTPHIARVHDVGRLTTGAPYMVMELLEGRDLDAVLREDSPLHVSEAIEYVLQACEALAEVHGRGMVHRDVKPANLFIVRGADGRPWLKLIDFGIARAMSPLVEDLALTAPQVVMGSPRYMAPEQIQAASSVDERADIYSLGVVLYELLTGDTPFDGGSMVDFLNAAINAKRVPPSRLNSEVPRGLDKVVLRCIEAHADDRWANVAELAEALAPFGGPRAHDRAENVHLVLTTAGRDTGRSRPFQDRDDVDEGVANDRSRIARRPRLLDTLEPPKRRSGGGVVFALVTLLFALGVFAVVRLHPLALPFEPTASPTTNAATTVVPTPSTSAVPSASETSPRPVAGGASSNASAASAPAATTSTTTVASAPAGAASISRPSAPTTTGSADTPAASVSVKAVTPAAATAPPRATAKPTAAPTAPSSSAPEPPNEPAPAPAPTQTEGQFEERR